MKRLISYAMGLALCAAGAAMAGGAAPEPPMSKDAYKAAKERIEQQAKAERKACVRLKGHAKDLCEAEAKAREKVAEAELEAQYEPSPDAGKEAKLEKAEAEYTVAKLRCAPLKDKAKDRCLQKAKHDREAAIRLAKIEKVEEVNEQKAKAKGEREAAARKQAPKS